MQLYEMRLEAAELMPERVNSGSQVAGDPERKDG